MRKLIVAGIACMILLVVCMAGCVGSDPIVGTWRYDKIYHGYDKFEDTLPDLYEYYDSYRIIFEPDGTGKYYDPTDKNNPDGRDFVWERIDEDNYKIRDYIGQSYYDEYYFRDNDQLLYKYGLAYDYRFQRV